jgi:hypothetical protein
VERGERGEIEEIVGDETSPFPLIDERAPPVCQQPHSLARDAHFVFRYSSITKGELQGRDFAAVQISSHHITPIVDPSHPPFLSRPAEDNKNK